MQAGDSWSGSVQLRAEPLQRGLRRRGRVSTLYTKAACGTGRTPARSAIEILKNGVVTLPSGHTFNAQLARVVADFCVYGTSGCADFFKVDEVRTVNYLWQVPYLGTVVRLQSDPERCRLHVLLDRARETDIKFGLFPPRSITRHRLDQHDVSLSWDPGLDTHRINGYKIYWDTDSGGRVGLRIQLGGERRAGVVRRDDGDDLRPHRRDDLLLHRDVALELHRPVDAASRRTLREPPLPDAGVRRSELRLSDRGAADDDGRRLHPDRAEVTG